MTERCLSLLTQKLGSQIIESSLSLGDAMVRIDRKRIPDFFRILKLDTELSFNFLSDITAVDWLDSKPDRFEVVYHLGSFNTFLRARVKVWVPENDCIVPSVTSLWSGANYMEREVWDMYGIKFEGHPDLRKILMYDSFDGFPLRKDYPVQGKQPRLPLRSPEVRNTAVDMNRPSLVQISRRPSSSDAQQSRGV